MPSTTLSSAGVAVVLTDWVGAKTTTVGVAFASSTSSAAFTTPIQVALISSAQNSSAPTWFNLSTAATGTYTSSTHFDAVPAFSITTPVAGVRVTSSSTSGGIVVTVLQNAGG